MKSSNVNCIFQVDESGGSSACAGCPEFLPMWQKGYGPKGGDKAERVVWHKYLDEMDEDDYIDMMTDVTVVDRNAPCALCPEFLPMWLKGYGPEGGDKATRKAWQNHLDGMNGADYIAMMEDSFSEVYESSTDVFDSPDPQIWANYLNQFNESEGFDVVDYPGNCVIGAVGPAFSDMSLAMIDKKMIGFSLEALKVYNHREGTHFTLYMVLKANMQSIAGALYFITFEAIDPYDSIQVFQAKVAETLENPKEVLLVRPKRLKK